MIRIDEVYYNVFLQAVKDKPISMHWFDPFGTTAYGNICSRPNIVEPATRILFWDQEPLYLERVEDVLPKFKSCYRDDSHGYDPVIVVTSEKQSDLVDWMCDTYGVSTGYYFFHGWAALDWYRGYNHSFLSQPWLEREFDHAFLCPNNIVGGQRIHRLRLLSALGQRECISQNLISFPSVCPYENKSVQSLFETHELPFPKSLSLPLIIDHDLNHAANSHRIDFWAQAMRCFCHVVTETACDDHRIHITEKTFKPIVLQQPFLIVGNQGALKYLRDYGFQTFGDIWDERYDDLDYEHRINAVADICKDITSWSQSQRYQVQQEIANVVQHNHDWFYGGFQDVLWKETCEMISRW
jgi:hypothetical protein